jgi:hypothetical protein
MRLTRYMQQCNCEISPVSPDTDGLCFLSDESSIALASKQRVANTGNCRYGWIAS